MNLDVFGMFKIEPNGTLFSMDHNQAVIDSKQLTGEEFMAVTGCDMVIPGMPASPEAEQCVRKWTTPDGNNDVSVKRDGEVFERGPGVCPNWCPDTFECMLRDCGVCFVPAFCFTLF